MGVRISEGIPTMPSSTTKSVNESTVLSLAQWMVDGYTFMPTIVEGEGRFWQENGIWYAQAANVDGPSTFKLNFERLDSNGIDHPFVLNEIVNDDLKIIYGTNNP